MPVERGAVEAGKTHLDQNLSQGGFSRRFELA
jgi:hypothetical protein